MRYTSKGLAITFLASTMIAQSNGQWVVHQLHPSNAIWSETVRTSAGQHVGKAQFPGGGERAGYWNGTTPESWVDIHPAGATASTGTDINEGKQVGYASVGGVIRASLWSGTAASWVDLHPAGASWSRAWGVSGAYQVGVAQIGNVQRASLWVGTALSRVDLHPVGQPHSEAYSAGDGEQVGWTGLTTGRRAALWRGTAASWVDLHPAGAVESYARAVSGGQQVGRVWFATGGGRAALWTGTAASFIDLNPAGATESRAYSVSNGVQVGNATFNGQWRAGYWRGTAASWTDLHSYLPAKYTGSFAHGVTHVGGITYIVGLAYTPEGSEAVLWVNDSPMSVSLFSPSVVGGVVTSGTVTFDQSNPAQRLVRMWDNSDFVLMSTYCVVPANQKTGTFSIWTYGVANTTVATISATYQGNVRTVNLTLTPATLDILWLNPTAVIGGNPSMGTVRLIGKAPAGGATVTLSSSNTAAANHAPSTVISWGASLKQFPVSTFGVNTNTNVVISATYAGLTRTAVISVRVATPASLGLGASSVKGGTPVAATVTMTGKTGPAGRTLFLNSNQPAILVPGWMHVPPQHFSWGFTVLTQAVTSNTVGTITVSQGAITRSATLTLTP